MKVGDRVVPIVDTEWFKKDAQGVIAELLVFPDIGPLIKVVWDGGGLWWALENELEVIGNDEAAD